MAHSLTFFLQQIESFLRNHKAAAKLKISPTVNAANAAVTDLILGSFTTPRPKKDLQPVQAFSKLYLPLYRMQFRRLGMKRGRLMHSLRELPVRRLSKWVLADTIGLQAARDPQGGSRLYCTRARSGDRKVRTADARRRTAHRRGDEVRPERAGQHY